MDIMKKIINFIEYVDHKGIKYHLRLAEEICDTAVSWNSYFCISVQCFNNQVLQLFHQGNVHH